MINVLSIVSEVVLRDETLRSVRFFMRRSNGRTEHNNKEVLSLVALHRSETVR